MRLMTRAHATVTGVCEGEGGPATSGGVSAQCKPGRDAHARGGVPLLAWTLSWHQSGGPGTHASRVTLSFECWLRVRRVESTGHTYMATATATAATCEALTTGHVPGAVVDVESRAIGGAVVIMVAQPAAQQSDRSATTAVRRTALPTDGNAVGEATVATPGAASTARRVHYLGARHRRADSAPQFSRAGQTRTTRFIGALSTKPYQLPRGNKIFYCITSCAPVGAGLNYGGDHEMSPRVTDTHVVVIGPFASNPFGRVVLTWAHRAFSSALGFCRAGPPRVSLSGGWQRARDT